MHACPIIQFHKYSHPLPDDSMHWLDDHYQFIRSCVVFSNYN